MIDECVGGCIAVVDTGNVFLGNPDDYFTKSVEKIKELFSKYKDGLPNLSYLIGDDKYELEPDYYLMNNSARATTPTEMLQNSWFVSMSVSVDYINKPLYILGQSFLSKYYNVYDFKNYKVGFALAKHNANE